MINNSGMGVDEMYALLNRIESRIADLLEGRGGFSE
jgi:hypothetical protein